MGGSRQGLNTVGITLNNHIFSKKKSLFYLSLFRLDILFSLSFANCFVIYYYFFLDHRYLLLDFDVMLRESFRWELHPLVDQTLVVRHVANDGGYSVFLL